MKNTFIKDLAIAVLAVVLLYLIFAFVELQANPLEWNKTVRLAFVGFSVLGVVLTVLGVGISRTKIEAQK